MAYRLLIMGLPGSGKTTLAQRVVLALESQKYSVLHLNADQVRQQHNDWDFTHEGRLRQSHRMQQLAEQSDRDFVVADFVCALPQQRQIFNADVTVWVDTLWQSRFADTNTVFVPPVQADIVVSTKDCDRWSDQIIAVLRTRRYVR